MTKIVDLTLPLEDGLPALGRLARPVVIPHTTHEGSKKYNQGVPGDLLTFTTFYLGMLDHSGTHIDALFHNNPDALILACFGEPGLGALRELSDIPMFGLLEASARAVAGRGKSFSILTPGRDWPAQMRELLGGYGLLGMCRGINVWPDAATEADSMFAETAMRDAIADVAAREGADAIILGGPHAIGLGADRVADRPVLVRDAFTLTLEEVVAALKVGR